MDIYADHEQQPGPYQTVADPVDANLSGPRDTRLTWAA